MNRRHSILLATAAAPFFFIFTGEGVARSFHPDSALVPIVALAAALIGLFLVYVWLHRELPTSLLPIGSKYREVARRVGFVLGMLITAPLFIVFCFSLLPYSWASFVPYILVLPGMVVSGLIIGALLVHLVFWCVDGFDVKA